MDECGVKMEAGTKYKKIPFRQEIITHSLGVLHRIPGNYWVIMEHFIQTRVIML